jgi:hypothetical protein
LLFCLVCSKFTFTTPVPEESVLSEVEVNVALASLSISNLVEPDELLILKLFAPPEPNQTISLVPFCNPNLYWLLP